MIARHANPATQAGFTIIPNTVMLSRELSIGAKLTYGYLKHLAWRNGSDEAASALASIAGALNVSQRAVQGYLSELRTAGLIESERRGLGLSNIYVVHDPADPETLPDGVADSATRIAPNPPLPTRAGSLPEVKTSNLEKTSPPISPSRKVDGKPITDAEQWLAGEILTAFNEAAGTRFTVATWAPKIVMRIREHNLGLDEHRQVIAANLADPWWKGRATPSVIYGSAEQFERSVAVVGAPSSRGMTPEEVETFGTTWGPGTGYATLAEAKAAGSLPVIEAR